MLLDYDDARTLLLKRRSLLCRLRRTVELKERVHLYLEQAMGYLRLGGRRYGFVVHGEGQGNFLGRFIHHAVREALLLTASWRRVITEQVVTLQMSNRLHNSFQVLP